MLRISISKEFSDTPGPRSVEEGDFSGEEFLQRLLLPRFEHAQKAGQKLLVDLDGVEGYATSFLEAAFGGLARKFGAERVIQTLEFKSDDEPRLAEEVKQYIRDAKSQAAHK